MPNIGPMEIAIVLIIALVVFGPKRLPSLGRSMGRGLTEFRQGLTAGPAEEATVAEVTEEPAAERQTT